MQVQIAERLRQAEERRDRAIRALDTTMEKIRALQVNKNWYSAYRTLGYYVGRFSEDIPEELVPTLCSDCLRLGIKGNVNMQELSQWFKKGVAALISAPSRYADAIDFLDAFGDYFMQDESGKGARVLGSTIVTLRDKLEDNELIGQLQCVLDDLGDYQHAGRLLTPEAS